MKIANVIVGQARSPRRPGPDLREFLGLLSSHGEYRVQVADSGEQVLDLMRQPPLPDVLIIENSLENPDVRVVCHALKLDPALSLVPILMIANSNHQAGEPWPLLSGCDDILIAPIDARALLARVSSLIRLKSLYDELDSTESVLATLARAIEAKDPYTLGHADRVSHFAVELGKALRVGGFELEVLRKGGLLHDVGKIAIPDAILLKPGKYTPEEFGLMKRHPVAGCEICAQLKSVREALPIIRHHHERLDGTGYPDGLKNAEIPALVRVVSIVDIYDALRSKRTYKEAFSIDQSFQILWEEVAKGWWDKDILAVWEKIVRSQKTDLLSV